MNIYIGRFTGHRALLLGWGIWLACLLVLPVSPRPNFDAITLALLILSNVALCLGLSSYRFLQTHWGIGSVAPVDHSTAWIDRALIPMLIAAGAIAMAARVLDYFVIRGIPLTLNPNAVRQALENSSPNLASLVYVFLYPAIYAAGMLGLVRLVQGSRSLLLILALLLFFLAPSMSILFGGRSVIFLVLALALVTLLFSIKAISVRFVVASLAAIVICFLLTMVLFLRRIQDVPLDVLLQRHGFAQFVPAADWLLIVIRDAPPSFSAMVYYVITVGQYVLHGLFEFFAMIQEKNPSDLPALGRYQFDLINRVWIILAEILELPITEIGQLDPRGGVYSTFWGPAYVDFGYFMVLYAFVWGAFVDYFRVQVQRGDALALPLYTLLIVQLFISPWINGFQMTAASYVNLGLFLLWAGGRLMIAQRAVHSPTGLRTVQA